MATIVVAAPHHTDQEKRPHDRNTILRNFPNHAHRNQHEEKRYRKTRSKTINASRCS
jgi:hypothetical protein